MSASDKPIARGRRVPGRRAGMEMTGVVRFAEFVFDADTRELRRGATRLPLSPKAYQLLEILVANRPRAISKTALQDLLWPETFVVEKNLVNLIAEIRQALGDDSSQPRFVRTVHRFGYAFREAPIEPAGSQPLAQPPLLVRVHWSAGHAVLPAGEHTVGRDPQVEIFLDSPGVSRRHARISVTEQEVTIEDLGSKNGTYVGPDRISGRTTIRDGDVFRVGPIHLTLRAIRPLDSTLTQTQPEH
jgi:DNA-binding winged helix-turn-helix (wHTH) protein